MPNMAIASAGVEEGMFGMISRQDVIEFLLYNSQ